MEEPPLTRTKLQQKLQTVVQKFGWTYSIFWKLCPQQGLLVWGDGHYNGSIKTRKTVQPTAESSKAPPPVERSEQLKELYEFLAADGDGGQHRRPDLALVPEDLTECEWFYLTCISFSFASGSGLPGKAFGTQNYVWLTKANDTNSKVFSRTILAKNAGIQTVVCIPLTYGVLELGTEEMVKEDRRLTQQIRNIFADFHINLPTPALSQNSTTGPALESQEEIYYEKEECSNGESAECEIQKAVSESEFEIGRNVAVQANFEQDDGTYNDLQHSADSMQFTDLSPEDVHYSGTVAAILQKNISNFLQGSIISQLSHSDSSSFSIWNCENQVFSKRRTSQWMLKYILFILPNMRSKKYVNSVHVLAERRRREKLNKWFMVLRASVPCVTKMGKASLLADTIEYIGQLTRSIHNLESQNNNMSNLFASKVSDSHNQINSQYQRLETNCRSKQELTHFQETKRLRFTKNVEKATKAVEDSRIRLRVSIIESTAVLGLQCPYKVGILLKIMQQFDELNWETTHINSTVVNDNFIAEVKAKVKKSSGKRTSAAEIKRAIHQLLSH